MFLKNKNIIFKIRRSKVTDHAALRGLSYDVASGSDITPCNKIDKHTSGLQMFGKRYDVNNNVAYQMTKV